MLGEAGIPAALERSRSGDGCWRSRLQPRSWSRSTTDERFEAVRSLVEKRTVLDMGCASGHWRRDWLHKRIRGVAKEVIGVDVDPSAVEQARSAGADIIEGDAETLRLGRRFEVVFAGELIEHLSCISDFLETARLNLVDDGVLVLTTPNVFAVSNFAYRFGTVSG